MPDFDSVLHEAQKLPTHDQLRLIDALWAAVLADAELPLDEAWAPELKQRVAAIDSGATQPISWKTVCAEALARIKQRER